MRRAPTASSRTRSRLAGALRRAARRLDARDTPFDRLVWLLGAPRTGSTWLASMLAAHPLGRWHDEPLLGAHLGVHAASTLEAVLEGFDQTVWELSRGRASYVFSDEAHDDWAPVLQDLLRTRLLAPARQVVAKGGFAVVKEPHGSEAARLLTALTPGSRLLFLVRDPRDCIDSVLDIVEHGWMGRDNGHGPLDRDERLQFVERILTFWTWRVDAVQATHDELPAHRRHLVRYEDLRAQPEPHLSAIVDWIDVPTPDGWAARSARDLAFERVPEERRGAGQFHRQARPGGWRDGLTDDEQAFATELAHDHLVRYGYPLA